MVIPNFIGPTPTPGITVIAVPVVVGLLLREQEAVRNAAAVTPTKQTYFRKVFIALNVEISK